MSSSADFSGSFFKIQTKSASHWRLRRRSRLCTAILDAALHRTVMVLNEFCTVDLNSPRFNVSESLTQGIRWAVVSTMPLPFLSHRLCQTLKYMQTILGPAIGDAVPQRFETLDDPLVKIPLAQALLVVYHQRI